MIFNNIKDEHGTHLSHFATLLQEKAHEAGLQSVFIFAAKDGPNEGLHVMSTIALPVPVLLAQLVERMTAEPTEKITTKRSEIVQ